jgi:hypothetical protein
MATIKITESKHYDLIGRVTKFEKPITGAGTARPAVAQSPFPILA